MKTNCSKFLMGISLFLFVFTALSAQNGGELSVAKVKISNGLISGIKGDKTDVLVFKGIPFAAPPVGDLRWKAPQPVQNWSGVKVCDKFGPNAMQNKPVPKGVYVAEFLIPVDGEISEDCLYLNVWTAAKRVNEKRPVIVYIHGGGFTEGSGSCPIYDGESMASKGVVFVTINYRLGIFGFFAHPELTAETSYKSSGNYAILDQIAALKWVKENIAAFGGDPSNVTVAGQSAGSMSVNAIAASPLAKGLFQRLIAESGASVVKGSFGGSSTLKDAENRGVESAKKAGASSLADLRKMSADELRQKISGGGSVIVDGYVIPEPIPVLFEKGALADVPLLTGWNGDDALFSMPTKLDAYKQNLKTQFGKDAATVEKLYPATNDQEAALQTKNLSRDRGFGIQNYAWARMHSINGKSKSYLYFFDRKVPEEGGKQQYGAFHSGEITYAYDNHTKFKRPWTQGDYDLAKLMSSYWVNFAKTGNPNGKGLPEWPAYSPEKGVAMVFNLESKAVKHPSYDALEFFFKKATQK